MSTWAAVIMCAVAIATVIWRDGITRGRVDTLLKELTRGQVDHEERIRGLESGRQQAGHGQLLDRRRR